MGKFQFWTLKWTLTASCLMWETVGGAQTVPVPRRWATTPPATAIVTDSNVRPVQADQPKVDDDSKDTMKTPASPPTLLDPETRLIDLNTALRLAGVQNPQLMIARQRVVEAAAARQLAAAQFLPSLNLGTNYDTHTGNLQQSNGNILGVNRSAVYVGAGASAVGSGTVTIPGVLLQGNVAAAVYGYLAAPSGCSAGVRHTGDSQPDVSSNDARLLELSSRSGGPASRRELADLRDEARRVAELTAAYANAGQGRAALTPTRPERIELQSRESDVCRRAERARSWYPRLASAMS